MAGPELRVAMAQNAHLKSRDASDGATEDKRVDIISTLVREHRLQVHHVTDDVVLIGDTVTAKHVT